MNRARLLFILGFVLSLGAGVVIGMVVGRAPITPAAPAHRGPGFDLGLTPQQDEKVREIWSAVRQTDGGRNDHRHSLSKERDDAIVQLIPADKKADYDRIQQEHAARVAEMGKEHERLVQEAEQKMKAVLTDAQWKRFEEMKRERADRGKNGRPSTMRGTTRPSSRPTDHMDHDFHER
jgi:Spy/CpxP family protein refolding chaperone